MYLARVFSIGIISATEYSERIAAQVSMIEWLLPPAEARHERDAEEISAKEEKSGSIGSHEHSETLL